MAGKDLRYGVGFVRQIAPLYIKNLYSPTRAYNAIRSRFALTTPRTAFFQEYNEIRSRFSFAPALARVGLKVVPRAALVNPTHRVLGNRYEYRLQFTSTGTSPEDTRVRYATLYFDRRVSLASALAELARLQATLAQRDPKYRDRLAEQDPPSADEVAVIHSIHTSAVRR